MSHHDYSFDKQNSSLYADCRILISFLLMPTAFTGGAGMSILDSDDDADMERSLLDQQQAQNDQDIVPTADENSGHSMILDDQQEQRSTIVDVPRSAIQPLPGFYGLQQYSCFKNEEK